MPSLILHSLPFLIIPVSLHFTSRQPVIEPCCPSLSVYRRAGPPCFQQSNPAEPNPALRLAWIAETAVYLVSLPLQSLLLADYFLHSSKTGLFLFFLKCKLYLDITLSLSSLQFRSPLGLIFLNTLRCSKSYIPVDLVTICISS